MPVYVTHLFGKNLKGAALPKEWVRAHLCSNDCDYFFSPVTYIKYICKDIVFPGTIAFMVFYLHTNMPKGTTSHTDKILVFSVITWGKHDYPHLQTRILNSNTCSFFCPQPHTWCDAEEGFNLTPLELFLTKFSDSPRRVFVFKTNQNIMFGLCWIIYLLLWHCDYTAFIKLPVQPGKYLHFCALI